MISWKNPGNPPLVKGLMTFLLVLGCFSSWSQQTRYLPLQEAIRLGLDYSPELKISDRKIDLALNQLKQARDARIPNAKLSFGASQAWIPTDQFKLAGNTIRLPGSAFVYLSSLSVSEALFAGNRLRYAEESARILQKEASLDTANNRNLIAFEVVKAYFNLVKVIENQKIITQNLRDVSQRLAETRKFEKQGLATENDVLRWELQYSHVQLAGIDLENNRAITNYNLDIMLGLPDSHRLSLDSTVNPELPLSPEQGFIREGLSRRKDLQEYGDQLSLSDIGIRQLEDSRLPTAGVGLNAYYLNPGSRFFPARFSFLTPITLGLNLGWNISSLFTVKNQVGALKIQEQQTRLARQSLQDRIRMEVNGDYRDYEVAVRKIQVYQLAVRQARENDRIMESKYQNQLANTTDRIDAETLLYQSEVNLELAKVDARTAYYELLKSTGSLQ